MTQCPVIEVDIGSPVAFLWGAKTPTGRARRGVSFTKLLACYAVGVTVDTVTWTVHPDDDDGSLTIDQQQLVVDLSSARISGGTEGLAPRIVVSWVLSDGTEGQVTGQVPVREVVPQLKSAA